MAEPVSTPNGRCSLEEPGRFTLWRHIKRGTTYLVLAVADCATTGPEYGDARGVVYQSVDDGRVWYRELSEFLDGRFEPIRDDAALDVEPAETVEAGQIYWTIALSDAYGDHPGFCEPWRGKITRRYGGPDDPRPAFAISAFDAESGEADDDSNATATVYSEALYDSEIEAWLVYTRRVIAVAADARRSAEIAAARCCDLGVPADSFWRRDAT